MLWVLIDWVCWVFFAFWWNDNMLIDDERVLGWCPFMKYLSYMSFWHKTLKNGTNFRCPAVWHAQGQMTETWRNSIVCSKFSILQVGLPLWAGPVLRGTGPMGLPIACNLSEILQRGHYLDNSIHRRTDVQLYTTPSPFLKTFCFLKLGGRLSLGIIFIIHSRECIDKYHP